jgi:hypothetical protein
MPTSIGIGCRQDLRKHDVNAALQLRQHTVAALQWNRSSCILLQFSSGHSGANAAANCSRQAAGVYNEGREVVVV